MRCPSCGQENCQKVGHVHRQVLSSRIALMVVRSVFAYQTFQCIECCYIFDKIDPHYVPWKRG